MRYLRRFVLGSALILSIGSVFAANQSNVVGHGANEHTHEVTKKEPSWMFVFSATKGEIIRGKDGEHLLVIQKADMKPGFKY